MIKITSNAFDPWQEVMQYQNNLTELQGRYGATAVFVGTMRDINGMDEIEGMYLEHYPEMTEHQINKIVDQAEQRWDTLSSLIIHRVGYVLPNDPIVLVSIWALHRGDAYDANRYIMESLKSEAPFWKKERLKNKQERWVEKNTNGYANRG